MRKILAVTGIRSEYDIMTPVYSALSKNQNFDLRLVVTGAHLSTQYGFTVDKIREDGFGIADEIESLISGSDKSSRLKGVGVQLQGLVQTVTREAPDFLMVLGDREEALNTAIVGAYLDIPVIHLCGGDKVIGNVDDLVRHAVTKMSHVHFTTNEDSKNRVLKLGEEPFRVFNVGNPGLDRFRQIPAMEKAEVLKWAGFDSKYFEQPLLLVVQHPLSSESEMAYSQMKETLEAVKALQWPTIISYPNSDSGSREMIKCIEEYRSLENLKIFPNVPTKEFCNTLRNASCLIGNSSMGCLEAPFLKLPTINVGNRQRGRLHGKNLVFCDHNRDRLVELVKKIVTDENYRSELMATDSPYGDGYSSEKIVSILERIEIDNSLLIKEITYE